MLAPSLKKVICDIATMAASHFACHTISMKSWPPVEAEVFLLSA